jgi:hypothetical protein
LPVRNSLALDAAKIENIHETSNKICRKCFKYVSFHVSKKENTFPSHVKQQIEDGKVRQEPVFLLIHLIIRFCCEIRILRRVLRIDSRAEILGFVDS